MNKKNFKTIFVLMSLTILLMTGCSGKNIEPVESQKDFLMDTITQIDIYEGGKSHSMKKAYARLYEIENRMSKTIATSDVSRLNELAGKEIIKINKDTYEVLEESKRLAKKTEGSFDPTIGHLVDLWKIKEGEEDRDWIPADKDINIHKDNIDYEKIELGKGSKARLSEDDIALDLGAIVKGYAADQVKDILLEDGVESAIIDLGGNLNLIGGNRDGEPWNIGIQDPFLEAGKHMGVLKVQDKSIVTSGNYERYFEIDDRRYHHIIDPETGYPSDNNLASVTIVSDESIVGDVYATAFFILGYEKSLELMKELDENIDAVFITKDKKVYLTEGIKDDFTIKDEEKFKLVD